jgi:predicted metal-dependent peptidase
MKPPKITLLQFDTRIIAEDQLTSMQEISRVKFTGRGGTQIAPVLQWADDNKPQLLLIFTDGGFKFPRRDEPKSPIIWLIHDGPHWEAPYGKVIHYEINRSHV